jgi:hypothetical protein
MRCYAWARTWLDSLPRPKKREDNIRVNLKTGCEDMNLISVAQDRLQLQDLVNTVMNFPVP